MANTTKKDPSVEDVETTQEETTQEKATEKGYKFVSSNKYLTVSSLGVQFVNGKVTVTDLEVARALATIEGVTLIED